MLKEQKIRDLTLKLIQVIVWFEILWAVVFLISMVFQWSGITDQLASAFFGAGFCGVLLLAALTLLNVTANMNIISKVQVMKYAGGESAPEDRQVTLKILAVSGALIAVVVLSLWFAEWQTYKIKVADTKSKIESIVDTKLIDDALGVIRSDGKIADLGAIRDALTATMNTGGQMSIIFPENVRGVDVYYEFTAWSYWNDKSEKKISEASLQKYVPREGEQKKWDKLIAGQVDMFTVPHGGNLRMFRRIKRADGELILLVDTSRRFDYGRSSFGK
jgi:hypothetical protein